MSDITIRTVASLKTVNSADWDALCHGDSPFQRHGFLQALEDSDSVGPDTGWIPSYILVERDGLLLGACAAYLKTDSYGEYIFDWAWARAAGHFGQAYYPKLVVAAPFTPATGQRLLVGKGQDPALVTQALLTGIAEVTKQYQLSGAHILFCTDTEAGRMEEQGLARRTSFQFHWRNAEYQDFEGFLAALKSRKRKQIRKERLRAQAAVDSIDFVQGRDMQSEDHEALERYYRKTVAEHGGFDYLRPGVFRALATAMPDTMLFGRARKDGRIVAGALFFETDSALYGRYWGADEHLEFLHFELAYYAGIERCIQRGVGLFEAGAQGSHKLLRGFEPTVTHSCHLISKPKFDTAIRGFLRQEDQEVRARMEELQKLSPYRCSE